MEVKVFGCKVNKYYTDKWLNSPYLKNKKGYFIATCAVTDKAKQKWIKFVKDIVKNIKNEEKIYITGCSAIKDGEVQNNFFELYTELKEFKNKIVLLGEDINLEKNVNSLTAPLHKGKSIKSLYTKKFVLVQGGCDSFCTFCLTVIKRGRHFSRNKEDILKEILEFEKSGGKEVVLTGINLGAWGLKTTNSKKFPLSDIKEVQSKLGELLEYILKNSKIKRIRISSLGPEFVDEKCLEIFKNPRIYPHFHYSVQSGSNKILKSMKRHYTGKYIKNILIKTKNIKREDNIDVSLGADIIVGFPGEDEKDFLETYNLIKEVGIQKIHAFPFSGHKIGESVPAGKFQNQINDKIKKERMEKITVLSEKIRNNFIESQKGKNLEVLIESTKNGGFKGWTQNYIEANNNNFEIISGKIKRNEIVIGKLF